MKCFVSICNFTTGDTTRLFSHYRNVHGFCAGSELGCSFNSCPRVFTSFWGLKRHLDHHQSLEDEFLDVDFVQIVSLPCSSFDGPMGNAENVPHVTNTLDKSIIRFFVMLLAKPNITLSNVQAVAENLCNVIDDFCDQAVTVVHDTCTHLGVNTENPVVKEACCKIENSKQVVRELDTDYKRKKWLEKYDYFVSPCTVALGNREVQRYCSRKKAFCSVLEEDNCQLVLLDKLLGKVLENSAVQTLLKSPRGNSDVEFLKDFKDGSFSQNHPFLQKFPESVVLHFFIDAYETVNPLGSHSTVHKLEGLYCHISTVCTLEIFHKRFSPRHVISF